MFTKKVLFILIAGLTIGASCPAQALWLSGYENRKEFTINGSTDGNLTNYQLLLNVYKGTGTDSGNSVYLTDIKDNFSDLRFTNSAGDELDYWVEEKTDGSSAQVWVEFDSVAQSTPTNFYVYYNNDSASSASNGFDTFIQFDDFEDASLGDWTIVDGDVNISSTDQAWGGTNSMKLIGGASRPRVTIPVTHSDNIAIRYRVYKTDTGRCDHYIGDGSYRSYINFDTTDSLNYNDGSAQFIEVLSVDTWYLLEVCDFDWSNHTQDFYRDDSQKKDDVGMRNDDNGDYDDVSYFLGQTGYGADAYVDNFIVRNFTTVEPTFGTWENEEMIPEPTSLLLLGFGVVGIAIFKKRLL